MMAATSFHHESKIFDFCIKTYQCDQSGRRLVSSTPQTIHPHNPPRSRIDPNIQQVSPTARLSQHNPISTASINIAHARNSTEPCDMDRFAAIEFTTS
jgi:hypothetical protein